MSNKLTPAQISDAATAAGFEPRTIRALLQVETGGSGYAPNGWLLIQFEPAWFRRQLPALKMKAINAALTKQKLDPAQLNAAEKQLLADWEIIEDNGVESQKPERAAFDAATRIDATTAQLSTSWGLPQMMGFNYSACGFKSVADMVESFRQSEANQLAAMLRWIRSKPILASALRQKEWAVVAWHYNGPAFKQFNYDARLAKAYADIK